MAPKSDTFRTQYEKPVFLNKLAGRYTVRWENEDGSQGFCRAWTRIRDFDGRFPTRRSVLGLVRSLRTRAQVRRDPILPEPIPFLVFDAIEFLAKRVKTGTRVLEVGGGNSTLWFLNQGAEVVCIESDPDWARHVRSHAEGNARLQLEVLEGREAMNFIDALPDASFDIVLIDSTHLATRRFDALGHALLKLRQGGWMVLDNSDHPQNRDAAALMESRERRTFSGYAPMGLIVSQTSIWEI